MMDSRFTDWKSGVGGRSRVRMRKGVIWELMVPDSVNMRRAFWVSEWVLIAWLSIRSRPWKAAWITLCGFVDGFLDPPRERCRLFRNQDRNSTGSDCCVRVNRFEDRKAISCSNSCGDTCDRNALGFHSFRTRVLKRSASCGVPGTGN